MNVVGKVGSLISQGVYSVASPFHPFGGAVDVIVVRQQDGTFQSTPWYVRFGKFQGVLKGAEKVVHITVNGVKANFHMCLDNSGEAYFAREVDAGKGFDTNGGIKASQSQVARDDGNKHIAQFCRLEHSVSDSRVVLVRDQTDAITPHRLERTESDTRFYELQDEQSTLGSGKGFDTNGGIEDSQSEVTRDDGNKHIAQFCQLEHSVTESRMVLVRDQSDAISSKRFERVESDTRFYEFQDEQSTLGSGKRFNTNGGIKDSQSEVTRDDGNKHIAPFCRLEHSVTESRVVLVRDQLDAISPKRLERMESDTRFYEFQEEQSTLEDPINLSELGPDQYKGSDGACLGEAQDIDSEVVLFSVDGHTLTVPVSETEQNVEDVQLSTPKFHIGPDEGPECCNSNEEISLSDNACIADCTNNVNSAVDNSSSHVSCSADSDSTALRHDPEVDDGGTEHAFQTEESPNFPNHQSDYEGPSDVRDASEIRKSDEVYKSCLEPSELGRHSKNIDPGDKPACISPNFNESKDEAIDDSQSKDVPSSSNNIGSPDLQAENKVLDSDYLGSNIVSICSVGNESQGKVEQLRTSESTEGINSSLQSPGPENKSSESENVETESTSCKETEDCANPGFEMSLCGNKLHAGMGLEAAAAVFEAHHMSNDEYKNKESSIVKNADLNDQLEERYLPREKAPSDVLGTAAFGSESIVEPQDAVPVEQEGSSNPKSDESTVTSTSSTRRWKLWPIPFIKGKTLEQTDNNSTNEKLIVDTKPDLQNSPTGSTPESPSEQFTRTNVPTTEQIASLNLKDGQNMVIFSFSTRVFGNQQVDAHLYLWKWNDKIVISDVDGTITKSDVLGQFMPLVGRDWTQSGVAKLFSAIKENGYQLLFLSARAIVQAYITRNFLLNLKQDGKALPSGPVVISPDGLFPSLYREVIRRAPHEFKISCLEDIKKLFPPDHNPFYAGFGNRDTDELSYRKIGIPKGKIFIINPKGEVAISHCINGRSYTSLHTLVDDMFPPASLVEQEDFNSWNFWKVPLPDIK